MIRREGRDVEHNVFIIVPEDMPDATAAAAGLNSSRTISPWPLHHSWSQRFTQSVSSPIAPFHQHHRDHQPALAMDPLIITVCFGSISLGHLADVWPHWGNLATIARSKQSSKSCYDKVTQIFTEVSRNLP